jgi:glycosyltransferase involved in cell wall biosynthesis
LSEHSATPTVSVVLPVYNDRRVCEAVECLLRQTLAPHEIIVVDDGSTDGTLERLREFGDRIILLSKKNGGPASARNCGVRVATGAFVAFTDSDCLPHEGWLAGLLNGFQDGSVGGVGGPTRRVGSDLLSEYADVQGFLEPNMGLDQKIASFPTANACFRHQVLFQVGLFNESFTKPGGEDVELGYRVRELGYELRRVEDALVLHHHRQSVGSLLKTMANYGEGQYQLDERWPERKRIKSPYREMIRSPIAARTMWRNYLTYRVTFDPKRAALFAFLDNYKHSAFVWGYLRGKKRAVLQK